MERYRSGHNEAVLKTVCPKGREGSNPSLSADFSINKDGKFKRLILGEVPKRLKGLPWKGSRPVNSGARVQIPPSPLSFTGTGENKEP